MNNLLEIDEKILKNLDQQQAVDFFRDILWAEALNIGISQDLLHIPGCINVSDGGIDACLDNVSAPKESWIDSGTTGYQIKAGNLSKSECVKELYEGKDTKRSIKPLIKEILEKGGYYVIISYKSLSGTKIKERTDAIKEELKKHKIKSKNIKFFDASKIKLFAEKYPSLIMRQNSVNACGIHYKAWSSNSQIKSPQIFIKDELRENLITEMRNSIREKTGESKLFRICGMAGIGKTRFTYELLNEPDLKAQTLYIKSGDNFTQNHLFERLKNDEKISGIFVVDDCGLSQHRIIEDFFSKHTNGNITIITLSTDCTKPGESTDYFAKLEKLSDEKIKSLLEKESKLTGVVVDRIVRFSEGYPRFAMLIAQKYRSSDVGKEEFLVSSSDKDLVDKMIAGNYDFNSDEYKNTKKVLMGLSIFSKVGFKTRVKEEAEWLAKHLKVSWGDFKSVVREQKERGLIQGDNFISITPVILSIYLLDEWWEKSSFDELEDFNKFINSIPEGIRKNLILHFCDNLKYIGANDNGLKLSKQLLKAGGFISEIEDLESSIGKNFFLSLTEANPCDALVFLQKQIQSLKTSELKKITKGRRTIVWALEKIVVWDECFDGAMDLLLELALAENESCVNNATGIFVSMFSTVYAPTQKDYKYRLSLLEEIFKSKNSDKITIGLEACDISFSTSATRCLGVEQQGIKKEAVFCRPDTLKELISIHKVCWNLLLETYKTSDDEKLKERSLEIMLNNSRSILPSEELAELVIETFEHISHNKKYKKDILEKIMSIFHYDKDGLSAEILKKLDDIKKKIVGKSYFDKLERYVGMDLLEDRFDRKNKYGDQSKNIIEELTEEMNRDSKLFKKHKEWLVSVNAKKGHQFGALLSKKDKEKIFLDDVFLLIYNAENLLFITGYLDTLHTEDEESWKEFLIKVYKDKKINTKLPELVWRSGVNDEVFSLILDLIEEKIINEKELWLFTYGLSLAPVSKKLFLSWIDKLLKLNKREATIIALSSFHYYFSINKNLVIKLPQNQTFNLITHKTLFGKSTERYQMEGYYWKEIVENFIKIYPKKSIDLASIIVNSLNRKDNFVDQNEGDVKCVLYEIAEQNPNEMWNLIIKDFGPPSLGRKDYVIQEWLKGGSFFTGKGSGEALSLFNPDDVYEWVDEDVGKRAWYLANFIPKHFQYDENYCWAREVLKRYGHLKEVRNNFSANYATEGWSGPSSQHFQKKKDYLVECSKKESDKNVLKWMNKYIKGLEKEIEGSLINEENRGF